MTYDDDYHWGQGNFSYSGASVGDAVRAVAGELVEGALARREVRRGGGVVALPGLATLEVREPHLRVVVLNGRRNNPWVTACEFPWLITGRNDVAWVAQYLPRAVEFSDDGRVWRAGYGPRLRGWGGGSTDQLALLVDQLSCDTDTRQAVLALWDPSEDLNVRSRDVPCTNWLHFLVRDGRLELTVVMRSNDLIWGFSGVNAWNFTLLQELVAMLLGLPMGPYRHVVTHLHVYDRHVPRLRAMGNSLGLYDLVSDHAVRATAPGPLHGAGPEGLAAFTAQAEQAMRWVSLMRWVADPGSERMPEELPLDTHLGQWAYYMHLWPYAKAGRGTAEEWWAWLEPVQYVDWKLAAVRWLAQEPARRSLAGRAAEAHGLPGYAEDLRRLLLDDDDR